MSTGLSGVTWQGFNLLYFSFPSIFPSPCFLIGSLSHFNKAKTIQHVEYSRFFRADQVTLTHHTLQEYLLRSSSESLQ